MMNYEDGNPMYEVGKKYKSDKITHHKYHEIYNFYLHLWTFKTPTKTLKKYKNVKSILMVLLFLLLFFY